MKNKTTLLVEIEHAEPLPANALSVTDLVAQRLYGWLLNAGVLAQVEAKLLGSVPVEAGE
ncbi:hypothetical protein ACT80S_18425 [Ramlibacter sp. MAHUQ-53]|uniref:hypothetical protein n=1 Tax=unclassified Ramlibacter TaxID=2617605 RepID=UPI003626B8EC